MKFQKLEMLRGFAATYVFAGHLLLSKLPHSFEFVRVLFSFGQEAVMVFFLLSGFVIFYSTNDHSDQSFRGYFIRRWKRIYPIFLLSILVTFACAYASTGLVPRISVKELFGNFVMFQDFAYAKPGVLVSPFLGNAPLWSLSYEWWFYMMFFPVCKLIQARDQLPFVAALSLIGYVSYFVFPNQVSLFLLYFILWWVGVELARTVVSGEVPTFRNQSRSIAVLAGMVLLLALPVIWTLHRRMPLRLGLHPVLELRHFTAALVLLCGGLLWSLAGWRGFRFLFLIFLPSAPISYALYVLHYPICVNSTFLRKIGPEWLQTAGYLIITLAIVCFAEFVYQKLVVSALARCSKRFLRAPNTAADIFS